MFKFDVKVPSTLLEMQQWFGSTIQTPLQNNLIAPFSLKGDNTALMAPKWIKPSPTLEPLERIQIYNQQYWWRLLSILQDYFPSLTRLFGYSDFNETLAIPFLSAHPSTHWSLNSLGDRFPQWIKTHYLEKDAALVSESAHLDHLYHSLFFKPLLPPLSLTENLSELTSVTLYLQPHVFLLSHPFNLLAFRAELLKKDVEAWLELEFPPLEEGPSYGYIMRSSVDYFSWKVISKEEFESLQKFQNGCSIDTFCEWLENDPAAPVEAAEKELQHWFQKWTKQRVLTAQNPDREAKGKLKP